MYYGIMSLYSIEIYNRFSLKTINLLINDCLIHLNCDIELYLR